MLLHVILPRPRLHVILILILIHYNTTTYDKENAVAGDLVGMVVGVDPDAATLLTYRLVHPGSSDSLFDLHATSGALVLKTPRLNYEVQRSYYLTVEAIDNGQPALASVPTVLQIHVLNINEAPVFFTKDDTTWTVPEMSQPGTFLVPLYDGGSGNVGDAVAWDPENQTLMFSVVPSSTAEEAMRNVQSMEEDDVYPIGVMSEEGRLVVAGVLDFEKTSLYEFDIVVEDSLGLKDSVSTTVVVTDANEPPSFVNDTYVYVVLEDQEPRTDIGTPTSAIDLDEEQELVYTVRVVSSSGGDLVWNISSSVTSGSGDADSTDSNKMFGIVACSGQLMLLRPLDFERQDSWLLEITATDNGAPPKTDVALVTVVVQDTNENPVFVRLERPFQVNENALDDVVVGRVVAQDPESDTLLYTLDNNDADVLPFTMDATTGVVTVKHTTMTHALDHEERSEYTLDVAVVDVHRTPMGRDEMSITVQVNNVEEPPFFAPRTLADNRVLYVSEFAHQDEAIGHRLVAEDPDHVADDATDAANAALTYTLSVQGVSDEQPLPFELVTLGQSQVQLRVLRPALLDFETQSLYTLAVTATDAAGLTAVLTMAVHVVNENEQPFLIAPSDAWQVPENSVAGTNVGAPLIVQDVDANQTYVYSLVGETTNALFDIVPATGQLFVRHSDSDSEDAEDADVADHGLDYEAAAFLPLTIRVTDSGSPSLSHELPVLVSVTNINEEPKLPPTTRTVFENALPGTAVGTALIGVDPDQDDVLTYTVETSLTSSLTNVLFDIDGQGTIRVATGADINYEAMPVHVLHVRTTDAEGLFSLSIVRIEIQDINEPPLVVGGSLAMDVAATAGAFVGQAALAIGKSFQLYM